MRKKRTPIEQLPPMNVAQQLSFLKEFLVKTATETEIAKADAEAARAKLAAFEQTLFDLLSPEQREAAQFCGYGTTQYALALVGIYHLRMARANESDIVKSGAGVC